MEQRKRSGGKDERSKRVETRQGRGVGRCVDSIINVHVYVYMCVCACVHVCVYGREREREKVSNCPFIYIINVSIITNCCILGLNTY